MKYEYEIIYKESGKVGNTLTTREAARQEKAKLKHYGYETNIVQKVYSLVTERVVR